MRALSPFTLARARQQAQVGVVADAFGDEAFIRALVTSVAAAREEKAARGTLRFKPATAFETLAGPDFAALPLRIPDAATSNTVVFLGDRLFVKGYRRLQAGISPEVEIGRYLSDVAHFTHCVPLAGSVEYFADDGRTATLALIQGYVQNQGSGWDYTESYLGRFFEDVAHAAPAASGADAHGGYNALLRTLGKRTGELHAAFAQRNGLPAFDPIPLAAADIAAWVDRVGLEADEVLDRLAHRLDSLPEPVRGDAERLLAARAALIARIVAHAGDPPRGAKTRLHSDYHLGQVLLVQNDWVITDFEGEPSRTMEERAEKHSPLKDVAGMLRSLDYAMHAALFSYIVKRPDSRDLVERAGRQWRAEATAAFVTGYDEIAGGAGLVTAREAANGLLELFILQKAVYELKYEVDNRPDWVRIPLAGLLDLLEGGR